MRSVTTLRLLTTLLALSLSAPALAQVQTTTDAVDRGDEGQVDIQQQRQIPVQTNQAGRIGDSAIGQVGQRETRENTERKTGIKPTARLASRIQNRIQSRIRNRIDRDYDPKANATDPFSIAEDQARKSSRTR